MLRVTGKHLGENTAIVEGFDPENVEIAAVGDLQVPPSAKAFRGAEVGACGGHEIDLLVEALDGRIKVSPLQGRKEARDERVVRGELMHRILQIPSKRTS